MSGKATQRTNDWLVNEVYPALTHDEAQDMQAAVMFYVLSGWEDRYPYPDMPEFLKPRWWYAPPSSADGETPR